MFRKPLLALLCGLLCPSLMNADWTLHRHEGRDYVELGELAAFYDLGTAVQQERHLRFLEGNDTLVVEKDSRAIQLNGITHWLGFPVIQQHNRWLVSRMDLGKTIHPALRPQAIASFQPVKTVVLDAGHGGKDKGAYGASAWEKDFNLDVVRRIRPLLMKAGLRVVLTRRNDKFVPLETRAALANRTPNAIFVSIHFNSAIANPAANGFEVFCVTPRGSPSTDHDTLRVRDMIEEKGNPSDLQSFSLANTIYHAMHGRLEMTDRGVKRSRFAVLRLTRIPAVLIEGGFLSNPGDIRKVTSRGWRDRYAEAIADGILEYKRLAEKRIVPRKVAQYRAADTTPVLTLKDIPLADSQEN